MDIKQFKNKWNKAVMLKDMTKILDNLTIEQKTAILEVMVNFKELFELNMKDECLFNNLKYDVEHVKKGYTIIL